MNELSGLHIAVVTHNVIKGDGQGRANYEIVRNAAMNGAKVSVVSHLIDDEVRDWPGVTVFPVELTPRIWKYDLFKAMEFAPRANKIIKSELSSANVIHGYGYSLNVLHDLNTSQFVHSAWRKNKYHTPNFHRNIYGAYQWIYSFLNSVWEKRAYRKSRHVVAASNTVRTELIQDIGISQHELSVVLNGADPAEFYPGQRSRSALGLPENVTLALFAGDIRIPRKNLDTVLQALVDVPDLHLAVAGRVAQSPFPALAQSLGIDSRVHFLDFRRDIADLMRACDFFVFPSRYEACALVLVEALASGLPIVSAKTTGGSEIVENGQSGLLIDDPNDVQSLAIALRELTNSPDLRHQMSVYAAEKSKNYTWERISSAYIDLYSRMARR